MWRPRLRSKEADLLKNTEYKLALSSQPVFPGTNKNYKLSLPELTKDNFKK